MLLREKKSLLIVRTIRNTKLYSVGRMHNFSTLKQVVHTIILASVLYSYMSIIILPSCLLGL
jgi:hypothetical protein